MTMEKSPVDIIYGILFLPGKAMRDLAVDPPLGTAVLVFLAVSLLSALAATITPGMPSAGRLSASLLLLLILAFQFLGWFLGTAVLQLTAELLGGKGRGRTLLALLGLANLPMAFQPPAALIGRLAGSGAAELLLSTALGVWSLVLAAIAIRESHRVSTGRAVLVLLLPLVAVVTLILLVAVLASAALLAPFLGGHLGRGF